MFLVYRSSSLWHIKISSYWLFHPAILIQKKTIHSSQYQAKEVSAFSIIHWFKFPTRESFVVEKIMTNLWIEFVMGIAKDLIRCFLNSSSGKSVCSDLFKIYCQPTPLPPTTPPPLGGGNMIFRWDNCEPSPLYLMVMMMSWPPSCLRLFAHTSVPELLNHGPQITISKVALAH